jgi:hypothetical protein
MRRCDDAAVSGIFVAAIVNRAVHHGAAAPVPAPAQLFTCILLQAVLHPVGYVSSKSQRAGTLESISRSRPAGMLRASRSNAGKKHTRFGVCDLAVSTLTADRWTIPDRSTIV